jgi:parallel beta-helix repeat protein
MTKQRRLTAVTLVAPLVVLALIASVMAAVSADASGFKVLARDKFARTVHGGWGSANVGGAWSTGGATKSAFSVTGHEGHMTLRNDGRGLVAWLPAVSSTQANLGATVSINRAATGKGLYVVVLGRQVRGSASYQMTVRLQGSGAVSLTLGRRSAGNVSAAIGRETVVPGVKYAPNARLNIRLDVVGTNPTTLRGKVWLAGTAQPTSWQVGATDGTRGLQGGGAVGIGGVLSTTASRPPVVLTVSAFNANGVTPRRVVPQTKPTPPTGTAPTGTTPSAPVTTPPVTGVAPSGRAAESAGSVAVGSARYVVPAGAVFVSVSGSDSASGSVSAPVASVARAAALVRAGGTVVVRGGVYHQSVVLPWGKAVTVQSYPGEAVWFDGSRPVSGWVRSGGVWAAGGWSAVFDHSPTYTKGAPDNTAPGWSFVSSSYPMAAYPDQVWVDGVAQQQVGSVGAVRPGSFFVDTVGHRLYLGSDPSGHLVRASDLATAFTVNSAGSVLRGFGVRDYATSLPLMGTVRVAAPSVTLENLVVSDNATQGISVGAADVTLRDVSALGNGLLGVHADFADGLRLIGVRASGNNTQHFNMAPVSGGVKITRSRGVSITGGMFASNIGPGVWLDASVYDSVIAGNDMLGNAGHGLSVEISAKSVIANNLVAGNGGNGMKINDSSSVQIWNNTIIDNGAQPLWVVQDSRVASNLSIFGHDPRRPMPDPTMTWLLGPVTVMNNVFARTGSNCYLCVQDNALHRSANQIGVSTDGNIYSRTSATNPTWLVVWPLGGKNPAVFTTIKAFAAATGQDSHSLEFDGAPVVNATGATGSSVNAAVAGVARPLPASIAAIIGSSAPHVGAWLG